MGLAISTFNLTPSHSLPPTTTTTTTTTTEGLGVKDPTLIDGGTGGVGENRGAWGMVIGAGRACSALQVEPLVSWVSSSQGLMGRVRGRRFRPPPGGQQNFCARNRTFYVSLSVVARPGVCPVTALDFWRVAINFEWCGRGASMPIFFSFFFRVSYFLVISI